MQPGYIWLVLKWCETILSLASRDRTISSNSAGEKSKEDETVGEAGNTTDGGKVEE